MAVKWIITDIDGCLSPEESVAWDLDLFWEFAQLSQLASQGKGRLAPFTLCTGRPQPYAEALAKILDIRAPMICESGAVLYSLHDNRARYGPGVTEAKVLRLRAVRAFLEEEVLPEYPDVVMQFGKEAHMSVFSEHPERFEAIQERVEAFLRQTPGPDLHVSASHFYLNIGLAGVDKGTTVRELLRELGATRDLVAGIGDTEGDLPLRENVAFFACPANARPAVQEAADYVSPYPMLEGVLDILKLPEFERMD